MRVTGNDKLDPDFSKMKQYTLVLGTITRDNMITRNSQKWILPRINPVCENCGKNQSYHIVMAYYRIIPLIKIKKTYHIVCSSCGEKIELDFQEYVKIKPAIIQE